MLEMSNLSGVHVIPSEATGEILAVPRDLGGRPPLGLTEAQVRYAMHNTYTVRDAASFLNISLNTFKRYAKMYIDVETGESLLEIHKRKHLTKPKTPRAKGVSYHCNHGYKERFEDVLAGRYPGYPPVLLRKRLLLSGWVKCECDQCGWDEYRITDKNYPLLIQFKDNNWRNSHIDNLRLLCFNCYFNFVRSPATSFQGWTYGTINKPRSDGRPKGFGSRKWKIANGIETESTYKERRRAQLEAMGQSYRPLFPDIYDYRGKKKRWTKGKKRLEREAKEAKMLAIVEKAEAILRESGIDPREIYGEDYEQHKPVDHTNDINPYEQAKLDQLANTTGGSPTVNAIG